MNYKKVIEDFNSGVLDKTKVMLRMDNDEGYWEILEELSDYEHDKKSDELIEKYGRPDGYRDIVDVLVAAGVNCDWC